MRTCLCDAHTRHRTIAAAPQNAAAKTGFRCARRIGMCVSRCTRSCGSQRGCRWRLEARRPSAGGRRFGSCARACSSTPWGTREYPEYPRVPYSMHSIDVGLGLCAHPRSGAFRRAAWRALRCQPSASSPTQSGRRSPLSRCMCGLPLSPDLRRPHAWASTASTPRPLTYCTTP
jgi:hypothetical protein